MVRDRFLWACAALALLGPPLSSQLTWRQAGAQPPAHYGQYAFFDEARGRITVFQGRNSASTYINDCWQLEDSDWIEVPPPASISSRGLGAACDDPSGGALLFGGTAGVGTLFADTLHYDPQSMQFSLLQPATSPPARWVTAMAFDSVRRRVVLFGGDGGAGTLNDTWEWDGSTWTQQFPGKSPGPRSGHVMAFDAARGRVVLYGGNNGSPLSDTWTYDGKVWTEVSLTTTPGAIYYAAMAYDAARGVTVLFGGQNGALALNGNTWEWDGQKWAQRPAGPPARMLASLTYDKQRRRVTLIAGLDPAGTLLRDAWTWDGTSWQQRAPRSLPSSTPPQGRAYHAAAYDSSRGRMVAFGGYTASSTVMLNDTLESDGFAWAQRTPAWAPTGRMRARMAFDSNLNRCYMFGGQVNATFTDNLLWSWTGNNWTATTGGATPPWARWGHDIAYDGDRRKLVVFGGVTAVFLQPENDTWEYDATTGWTQRSPATSPSRRYGHAMAWHAGDHGTYLFGGSRPVGGLSDELWFWDGTSWTFLLPSSRPPAMVDCAMCYDPSRNRLVLFGGWDGASNRNQVYEYDGIRWQLRTPSSGFPAARAGASLVYDSKNRKCVLYGGTAGATYFNDVWEWDGAALTWTRRPHAGVPEARGDHAMSYDPVRRRTVLFGGNSYGRGLFDDTWEWNGSTWTPNVTVQSPTPRFATAMAFDQGWGETVLVGGADATSAVLGDTWVYNGTRWAVPLATPLGPRDNHAMASLAPDPGVLLTGGYDGTNFLGDTCLWTAGGWLTLPVNGPGARDIHAMAYDPIRRKVVLFGGRDVYASFLNDTWEFDVNSSTWTQRAPATIPPGRWNHAMTFDAARGRVVMTGGYNGAYLDDLWEWNGSDWLSRAPETTRPPGVENSGFAYDQSRGRAVWFGGNGFGLTADLWELSAPVDVAGLGQPTGSVPLLNLSQPALGRTFALSFANPLTGGLLIGAGPVQGPLFTLPAGVTCGVANLFTNLSIAVPVPSVPIQLPVPNNASLLLKTLVFQGMALQPQVCVRMTDALHATIQLP